MKKYLLAVCLFSLLTAFSFGKVDTFAASDSFITADEAVLYGEEFIDTIHQIIKSGGESQYFGTWVYDVLIDWKNTLSEMGIYSGIKNHSAVVDDDKAAITLTLKGTKRNAVVEITLHKDIEPEINMYSKFSLSTWMFESELGAFLILLNTVVSIILFILVLKRPKPVSVAEKNQSIDQTIANIISHEEGTEESAETSEILDVAETLVEELNTETPETEEAAEDDTNKTD